MSHIKIVITCPCLFSGHDIFLYPRIFFWDILESAWWLVVQLVCWCDCLSVCRSVCERFVVQIPSFLKGFQWNFIHIITIKCICSKHNFCASQFGHRWVMPLALAYMGLKCGLNSLYSFEGTGLKIICLFLLLNAQFFTKSHVWPIVRIVPLWRF